MDAPEELFKLLDDFHIALSNAHEDVRKEQEVKKVPGRFARLHGNGRIIFLLL